ncbi:MAG: 1-acyl-sn-glycerol-3-phosphate acyltransferase [Bacteroidales bacterium]|nr:1-acyl-sn-glycerol-3-phosphate acyltransferase [Bacteroidales bacterium]MDY0215467.1 1-acyl-sn-glycerol-3-phosphate acyltransferase [Bacteroidales bacterium]
MGEKRNIYDNTIGYRIARFFVDLKVKSAYKKTAIVGLDKIPKDRSVILATNHSNALMDAINILAINKEPKVFIARGDIFINKSVRKFLRFAKILPIFRIRNGISNVKKSEETIDIVANVLADGKKVHIFPEGAHRSKHDLLPIGKGILRIALSASDKIKNDDNLYILPIGVEYGDYYRYQSTLLMFVGDIINVTEYINSNPDKSEYQINVGIREEIRCKLAETILYINQTDDYDAIWELTKLLTGNINENEILKRFNKNREISSKITELKNTNPQEAEILFRQADRFMDDRKKAKISIKSIANPNTKANLFFNSLLALLGLPFYVLSVVLYPNIILSELFLIPKIKDKTFWNTARFANSLVLNTIFFILWTILSFVFLDWFVTLLVILSLIFLPKYFYIYSEFVRILASDFRYIRNKDIATKYNQLKNSILNLIK